ncbi:MAG: DUF5777 family beta-barrel protein [Bacteroidota bacterium]
MTRKLLLLLAFTGIISVTTVNAQEDLMSILNQNEKPVVDYASATFKSTHIVIGQSIETAPVGNLNFMITHHFGSLNSGYDKLFGLKQAFIRLGFEYGVTKWLGIAVGLNTDKNTWDGSAKVKLFRQCKGAKRFPVTIDFYGNAAAFTTAWSDPTRKNHFSSRLTYAFQLLIARKFGNIISLQLTPSVVHKNMVPTVEDKNDIFALGAGGRVKLSERVALSAEYHHLFNGQVVSATSYDSFSVGVDIETGGHVFQIFLTNSSGEYEQTYLTETSGKWMNGNSLKKASIGNVFLGFNINRMFTIVNHKMTKQ